MYLPQLAFAHPQALTGADVGKVDVCHLTGTHDVQNGQGPVPIGHVIIIADPAYPAHIDHGDPEQWTLMTLADGTEVCTPSTADACPCWSAAELGTIGTTYTPNVVDYYPYSALPAYERFVLTEFGKDGNAYRFVQVFFNSDQSDDCTYTTYDATVPSSEQNPFNRSLQITDAEAAACRLDIETQRDVLVASGVDVVCSGNLCE
jgi:hypothetical protein